MNKIFYLLVAAGIVIIAGTVIMYNLEKGAENSQMTTLLDACGGALRQLLLWDMEMLCQLPV